MKPEQSTMTSPSTHTITTQQNNGYPQHRIFTKGFDYFLSVSRARFIILAIFDNYGDITKWRFICPWLTRVWECFVFKAMVLFSLLIRSLLFQHQRLRDFGLVNNLMSDHLKDPLADGIIFLLWMRMDF